MTVELRMPNLGMAMDEGRLCAWFVAQGDRVERGQVVAEIESEKVSYELESPSDGIVGPLLVAVDDIVPVGTTLVTIDDGAAPAGAPVETSVERPALGTAPASAPAPASASANAASGADGSPCAPRGRLSPRARKLAETLGVDASAVTGTGVDGLVLESDIRRAAQASPQQPESPEPAQAGAPFVLRPLTLMHRTIAERMTASAREAPHFFLTIEADGSALIAYRRARASNLEAQTGVRLTVTDLLVQLTGRTLRDHRALNASFAPDGVREWNDVNIALAVAVDNGLQVPVIRRADSRSLGELMVARADLVNRARAGKLRAGDVADGTFTVSNLGGFGIDLFSSIINPGQSAILSVGALRDRPVVVAGAIAVRPTLPIGLTIDHRVTDGAGGARFLAALKARIERLAVDDPADSAS